MRRGEEHGVYTALGQQRPGKRLHGQRGVGRKAAQRRVHCCQRVLLASAKHGRQSAKPRVTQQQAGKLLPGVPAHTHYCRLSVLLCHSRIRSF